MNVKKIFIYVKLNLIMFIIGYLISVLSFSNEIIKSFFKSDISISIAILFVYATCVINIIQCIIKIINELEKLYYIGNFYENSYCW